MPAVLFINASPSLSSSTNGVTETVGAGLRDSRCLRPPRA